jgi:hypothetical protein
VSILPQNMLKFSGCGFYNTPQTQSQNISNKPDTSVQAAALDSRRFLRFCKYQNKIQLVLSTFVPTVHQRKGGIHAIYRSVMETFG